MFLDSKTGRSVIFKYILTGMSGFSLGAIIGILISIVASFISPIPINSETDILIIVISISGFGTAFFGIVSKDIKKTLHYGAMGSALGIFAFYSFMSSGINYYLLLILPAWGFAIGLPRLKNAVISAGIGLAVGILVILFILLIMDLPIYPLILIVFMPFFVFFSLLIVGTATGLTVYGAEKIKGSRVYFNDTLLTAILAKGIGFLIIATIIFIAILTFMFLTYEKPPEDLATYRIYISGNDQEQYSIYFPSLVQGINASEMLENATLSGNGTYYVTENITSRSGDKVRALAISGSGNITFTVSRRSDIEIGNSTKEIDVYFQGKNESVVMRIEGHAVRYEQYTIYFNTADTRMIEGWQNVSEILFPSILE